MTEKKENNGFGRRVKKAVDAKMIAIIVLIVYNIGEGFYITYQEGAENQQYEQFKADATSVIEEELRGPNLLLKVFNSEFVDNFAAEKQKEIELQILNQVLADTSEVNFITLLGVETGLRDAVVEEKFKAMFTQYVNGELLTADQVKELIKSRTISASF